MSRFRKGDFCGIHEFGPPLVDVYAFEVALFVFSRGACANGRHTDFKPFVVFSIVVIILARIRFRTVKEHIPALDPSVIGSHSLSGCRALLMKLKNAIDSPTINHLQLGKIRGMQERIPKGILSSKRSYIVCPISACNGINPKWFIFKKLWLTKGVNRVFLDIFDLVFVCGLQEINDVRQRVYKE